MLSVISMIYFVNDKRYQFNSLLSRLYGKLLNNANKYTLKSNDIFQIYFKKELVLFAFIPGYFICNNFSPRFVERLKKTGHKLNVELLIETINFIKQHYKAFKIVTIQISNSKNILTLCIQIFCKTNRYTNNGLRPNIWK